MSDLEILPVGVKVSALSDSFKSASLCVEPKIDAMSELHKTPMLALNSAYLNDGVVVEILDGTRLDIPIHLIFIGVADETPIAFHPRNLINLGEGAIAEIYESHVGLGGTYLNNGATAIQICQGSLLRHHKLQNESTNAYHVSMSSVGIAASGCYENYTLHVGGKMVRNEIHVVMHGEEANCNLYGSYAGRDSQHIDTTTFVDHAVPKCTSREVYKGALDDNARGVFQGKILVRQNAQKTDGHQLNKALLLSKGAEVDAKPELEIYADDVKCSHGATTGELDEEQLFYMRARGINESEATDLLVAAFLEESLDFINSQTHGEAFRRVIAAWLAVRREHQEN